jgi:hypothetical protein
MVYRRSLLTEPVTDDMLAGMYRTTRAHRPMKPGNCPLVKG